MVDVTDWFGSDDRAGLVVATRTGKARAPFHHTGRRLAKAPPDYLAVAASRILGHGHRVSLLLAAAAETRCADLDREASAALTGLLPDHRVRLLDAVNLALTASGRSPV